MSQSIVRHPAISYRGRANFLLGIKKLRKEIEVGDPLSTGACGEDWPGRKCGWGMTIKIWGDDAGGQGRNTPLSTLWSPMCSKSQGVKNM